MRTNGVPTAINEGDPASTATVPLDINSLDQVAHYDEALANCTPEQIAAIDSFNAENEAAALRNRDTIPNRGTL